MKEDTRKGQRTPQVPCPLLVAACLLFGSVRLWCVVKLPRLDNVFLVVVNAVAVYVDANFDFVLLAVVDIAGIKRKAVLAAQEGID